MQDATARRLRALFTLAWPVILARSSQAVVGFCDALMIAPLGKESMAAVTTGAMNVFALAILPMGTVFIVQSFAAQLASKNELAAARRYAYYGLILTAVTAAVALAAIPFVPTLLAGLHYEPLVHEHMSDYIGIRLLAVGAIVGTEVLGNWYGGLGNTRLHMLAGITTMVANVFLNWVLIGGNLGAPALGVAGAAFASVMSSWIGFAMIALVFSRRWFVDVPTGPLALRASELWRMVRFGVPNGLNWFLEFAAFAVFVNVVVAHLGTTVLAAMMVVINVNSISFMPAFGMCSSGAIMVGQAIGRGEFDEVPAILRLTTTVTACWQGAVAIMYLAIPGVLIGLFEPEDQSAAELLEVGTVLLAISATYQLFDAVGMSVAESLRAAGDTSWCLYARIAVAWLVFTPGAYVSVVVLGGNHIAAMVWLTVYLAILAAVFTWRFRGGAWRKIDLTGIEPVLV